MGDEKLRRAVELARDGDAGGEEYEAIARAFLALCPADDGEPADESWLRSLGFVPDGVHLTFRGWGPDRNGTVQVYGPDRWLVNGTRVEAPATRGDVRALLRGLKVPAKEGG